MIFTKYEKDDLFVIACLLEKRYFTTSVRPSC